MLVLCPFCLLSFGKAVTGGRQCTTDQWINYHVRNARVGARYSLRFSCLEPWREASVRRPVYVSGVANLYTWTRIYTGVYLYMRVFHTTANAISLRGLEFARGYLLVCLGNYEQRYLYLTPEKLGILFKRIATWEFQFRLWCFFNQIRLFDSLFNSEFTKNYFNEIAH